MDLQLVERALVEATTVEEVKELFDKGEAVRLYLKKQRRGLAIQNRAAEFTLRAARKLGILLGELHLYGGDRTSSFQNGRLTLESLGIEYHQSHRWQRIASLPEDVFERSIAETKGKEEELTTAGVLALAEALKRSTYQAPVWGTPPRIVDFVGTFHEEGREMPHPMNVSHIYQGDTLAVLRTMPDEFVDCIVTSPPYFGLRDYGIEGQLGLENTLDEYLEKMLAITAELKRVLKKTGTLWWNHGDSYGTGSGAGVRNGKQATNRGTQTNTGWQEHGKAAVRGYEKSLLLQNFRLAQMMVDEQQWILRNVIIWWKPNGMPSSAKDRFTVDYEPVFFWVKSEKYWFEPQFEVAVYDGRKDTSYKGGEKDMAGGAHERWQKDQYGNDLRHKRCVWRIPTQPFPDAHFATFPEDLIVTPIKAGCPEMMCKKCGMAREKLCEREYLPTGRNVPPQKGNRGSEEREGAAAHVTREGFIPNREHVVKELGYSDCGCNAGWEPGIVLDPFMGSGTTALVARELGRTYIGIELNRDYINIAERRLRSAYRISTPAEHLQT